MAARSLNKVIIIGNLTRDPELRYHLRELQFVHLELRLIVSGLITAVKSRKMLSFIM